MSKKHGGDVRFLKKGTHVHPQGRCEGEVTWAQGKESMMREVLGRSSGFGPKKERTARQQLQLAPKRCSMFPLAVPPNAL